MKTRSFLFVALAIRIAASFAYAAEEGGDSKSAAESATLKRILAHWKARQDRVKSFHVVVRDRLTLLKGSIDNLREPEKKGQLFHCDKDEVYQSVQEISARWRRPLSPPSRRILQPAACRTERVGTNRALDDVRRTQLVLVSRGTFLSRAAPFHTQFRSRRRAKSDPGRSRSRSAAAARLPRRPSVDALATGELPLNHGQCHYRRRSLR